MGYTHYWRNPQGFTNDQWKLARELADAIIRVSSVPVQYEYDVSDPPRIDDGAIRFNGVDEDGHETFFVQYGPREFEFCKTARKPYDEIVVAMLFMLEHVNPSFSWSSDGDSEDHQGGYDLLQRAIASVNAHG